jgi:hypothetical protein
MLLAKSPCWASRVRSISISMARAVAGIRTSGKDASAWRNKGSITVFTWVLGSG